MIRIYGLLRTRALRPLWLLEEIGAEYELINVDLATGANRSDEFLRLNPAGKLPVMIDDGLVLCESAAIMNYIGTKYPASGLVPASDDPLRPRYDQWMFFTVTELEQALWNINKHTFSLPQSLRLWQMEEVGRFEFDRAERIVSLQLEQGPYILGDRFTAVDILLAQTLLWATRMNLVSRAPVIEYTARMKSRPSYKRVTAKHKKS